MSQDAASIDLNPGDLFVAVGVVPSNAQDNDGDERHQEYVRSVTEVGEIYVNRVFFNGDSAHLEKVT